MVEAGTLFSDGASPPNGLRRFAHWVDKILEGAKPADLTVKPPTRFELVINLKAAEAPASRSRSRCCCCCFQTR